MRCIDDDVSSGGSSIGCSRRTPPPFITENIAFSCIFRKKVKLTPVFSAKMWSTPPPLLHILDSPLVRVGVIGHGGLLRALSYARLIRGTGHV